MQNGGLFRWNAIIPPGNLTQLQMLQLLPFGNVAGVHLINGTTLRKALENSVAALPLQLGQFAQIGGFRFTHTCNTVLATCGTGVGARVTNVTYLDGTPILPADSLYIVTNDYMTSGGNGYLIYKEGVEVIDSDAGQLLFDVVLRRVQAIGPISPQVDGRIIEGGSP